MQHSEQIAEAVVVAEPQAVIASDPADVIPRATAIANQLATVIRRGKCTVNISGREHVKVEGWTTLLAMLHIQPEVEWSRPLLREGHVCYESRVALIHWPTGRRVGSAEAMASDSEPNAKRSWGRDEFSVRSMSQTRAVGKAGRLAFSWIMVLAGFDPTPSEEMTSVKATDEDGNELMPPCDHPGCVNRARHSEGAMNYCGLHRPGRPAPAKRDPANGKAATAARMGVQIQRDRFKKALRDLVETAVLDSIHVEESETGDTARRQLLCELLGIPEPWSQIEVSKLTEENWRTAADRLWDRTTETP